MTNPQMLIRIAGSIDELRKNLAEGKGLIETTTAAMQKLAASLDGSKLEQRAHNIVAAINDVGGASKLTVAEAQRLLGTLDAWVEKGDKIGKAVPPSMLQTRDALRQVVDEAEKGRQALEATAAAAEKGGGFFGDLTEHVKATALGFISAEAVIGGVEKGFEGLKEFVVDSVKAYADAEAGSRRLAVAIQTQGLGIPGLIDQYGELSEAYQRNTAFSHDAITAAQALFVQLGNVGPDQMDKALRAATDLSAGLQIDLNAAVTLVAKAFEGQTSSLQRYGIVLDQARIKGEGMSYVLDAIEAKVGGQAQAELDTYAGKIKQLGNEWEDLKQKLGETIVTDPLLQKLFSDLEAGLNGSGAAAQKSKGYITDWIATIAFIDPYTLGLLRTLRDWYTQDDQVAQSIREIEHELDGMGSKLPKLRDPLANATKWLSDLKQEAKDFADQEIASWQKADDAAKEAAKQHAAAIKQIQDSLTHADLTRHANDLAEAFSKLSPQQKTLDMVKALGAEAADIIVKGGHVPKLLQDIAVATGALDGPSRAVALDFKEIGRVLNQEVSPAYTAAEARVIALNPKFKETVDRLNEIFSVYRTGIGDLFKEGDIGTRFDDFHSAVKQEKREFDEWYASIQQVAGSLQQLGGEMGGIAGEIVSGLGRVIAAWGNAVKAIQQYKTQAGGATGAQKTAAVIGGAADVYGSTGSGSTLGRTVSGAAAGAAAGMAIGAAFAPATLGTSIIIGAAVGALVGWIRGMHESAKETKAANEEISKLRGTLVQTYGSLANAQEMAKRFGLQLDVTARGKQGLAELQAQMDALDKTMQALNEDIQKYGLTWQSIADPAQRTRAFQAGTQALYDSFTRLMQAGYSTSAIVKGMSGDINQWLSDALDAGQKIPPGMQPIIEQLIQMGQLTDDNARKLLGLGTVQLDGGSFDDIMAAAGRYGLTLDQLGAKVNQLNINKVAQQLSSDWKLLTSDGEDVNAVMQAMAPKVQEVVNEALRFGDTVPEAMKPMLQAMVDAGLLTDDTGTKLKDLSGIKFERPLTDAVDELITKLGELIDKISGGVGGAISRLPRRVDIDFHGDQSGYWPGETTDGGSTAAPARFATGGLVPQYLAGGGYPFIPRGTDTVPAMLTPGEVVLNAAQQRNVAGELTGSTRGDVTVKVTIQGWDGTDIQRTVESKRFADAILRAVERNTHGMGALG